jgi:hypothetical protein
LWLKPLLKPLRQPAAKHPDQKFIIGKAGFTLVFNGHLWRRVAREMGLATEAQPDIPERLTPAAW